MTKRFLRVRLALLAMLSIIGIVGMLLAEGGWDRLFLALAALPLLLGGAALAANNIKAIFARWHDDQPVGDG